MASPVADSYNGASGTTLKAGRYAIPPFDSVSILSADGNVPTLNANQTLIMSLHGSGGANFTTGRQYRAAVSGYMAHHTYNEYSFYTVRGTTSETLLKSINRFPGASPIEDMYLGYQMEDGKVHLSTYRRLMAWIDWAKVNIPNINWKKNCVTGGSMGGWGTMTTGIRRPDFFAAMYPDRPRWRYCGTDNKVWICVYGTGFVTTDVRTTLLAPEDGGGYVSDYMDMIAYVSNTANKIPWIGWNVGWNDGYTARSDHVAAVAAMRAAKRGFAFAWNNGDHVVGTIPGRITASYPYGTFELGKGYPLFTEHSLDGDPAVDLVGGINEGLSFRNVVESASGWACEVTHISSACTVKVEPLSDVFTTPVTAQLVTIPSANTWVAVSFTV